MKELIQTILSTGSTPSRPELYFELTKPDVSFLVVMTTAAGHALGAVGPIDWLRMSQTVIGSMLIAAGASALNHYLERDTDASMRRTMSRPLPSGQLNLREVLFGVSLITLGTIYLGVATNALATFLQTVTSGTSLAVGGTLSLNACMRFAPTAV